ncbi:MAG TPA: ATP synthase F1 subunit delta [Candidatus Moranbacteria bacterium]|nr:ATP synthase F1 subunit delta [Candidatus Moranbacteria bacterium]HAT75213.1 ATP synthase F1 subunit delta [Candidatus Moranbacteria bacterium]
MKITTRQYAKSLFELTSGKSEQEIKGVISNFIKFLQKNRQLKLAGKIIEKFGEIYNKKKGIVEAEIVSREKLNGELIVKLDDFIKNKYSAKEVMLNNKIDEKIIGGVIIKIGDEVMDGSVGGQLNRLRKCLEIKN